MAGELTAGSPGSSSRCHFPHSARLNGGVENYFDGPVGLVLKHLVGVGCGCEREPVGGKGFHAERVVITQHRHDVLGPSLDVGLPHPELDLLVEQDSHR